MSYSFSIGSHRTDGDFEIFATLNNKSGLIGDADFLLLSRKITALIEETFNVAADCLPREDASDFVNLQDE